MIDSYILQVRVCESDVIKTRLRLAGQLKMLPPYFHLEVQTRLCGTTLFEPGPAILGPWHACPFCELVGLGWAHHDQRRGLGHAKLGHAAHGPAQMPFLNFFNKNWKKLNALVLAWNKFEIIEIIAQALILIYKWIAKV